MLLRECSEREHFYIQKSKKLKLVGGETLNPNSGAATPELWSFLGHNSGVATPLPGFENPAHCFLFPLIYPLD